MNQVKANVTIPVSMKFTVNIGRWIKGDNVNQAIRKLKAVMEKKEPLPIVTHKKDTSHKKGIAAGKYPVKTAKHVIKTLNLVKANARHQGLDDSKLIIKDFIPNLAYSKRQRGNYKRGRSIHLKVGAVIEK